MRALSMQAMPAPVPLVVVAGTKPDTAGVVDVDRGRRLPPRRRHRCLRRVFAAMLLQGLAGVAGGGVDEAAHRAGPIDGPGAGMQLAQASLAAAHGVRAAAALVIECRAGRPAMLGVLHARDGRLLLSLPGGRADPGETAAETAQREALEETGYAVTATRELGSPPAAAPGFAVVLAEIEARPAQGPGPGEVVVAVVWLDPRRVPASAWRFAGDREWVVALYERHAPADCR